jgi:DNA modification methylase
LISKFKNKIIQGDCLDVLKGLPDNSVDSVVTDPPYGLSKEPDIKEVLTKWLDGEEYDHGHKGFMGKSWDSFVPHLDIWKEVYRVLKPGGHALVFAGTRTQDLMTVSLRLAGFEVRDVIEWLYFCLSDDTQALTREGWKSYKEITEDDFVMQWDSETGEMSWVKPEAIHVFPYNGKMLNFKSRATDQLVTPNHRMYVDVKKHSRNEFAGKYEVYEAKDLKRHWHKRFPLAGTYEGDKSIGINRAKLLGWFLTDAWVHGDGKAVMFSQSKPETLAKLREVLDEADVTYSEYTKEPKKETHNIEHTFYVTGKDVDWLLKNYGDRRFNNDLLDLVSEERAALLESFIDGDGSRSKEGLLTFWSMDEDFRNFVRQLMFTLNMRTSVDNKKGCVRGSTRFNDTELQYKHGIHEVDYEGNVWCVTVPKGAFVVKRNDHVFITGNSGFPKSHDVSKAFDKRAGAERKVISEHEVVDIRNGHGREYGSALFAGEDTGKMMYKVTAPATELARKWDGWGTALKPAHEPIILVRKPFKGAVVDNVEQYGTGAINIDGCRIGDEKITTNGRGNMSGVTPIEEQSAEYVGSTHTGRFPANCITLDDDQFYSKYFLIANVSPAELSKKASKKDRNSDWQGNEIGLEVRQAGGLQGRADGSLGKKTYNRNTHPTVKPTDLMAWLIRLITPPNGITLDPFAGSGSTCVAAKREGFDYIGIEMTPEYVEIAKARTGEAV